MTEPGPYVHHLSPFVWQITENFGVRWYGLAYVLGFLAAILLLRFLVRKGCSELTEEQAPDFIIFGALFGVMLGGRLGYMLFYDFHDFIRRPWIIVNLLGGGMSSHGGILGLFFFTLYYARRHKLSWAGLGDNLVTVSAVGLFLGRIANFINGELYGHPTRGWWGVVFPRAAGDLPEPQRSELLTRLGAPDVESLVALSRQSAEVRAQLAQALEPRHPSQLYEAGLEGLFLFAVLFAVRLRWKNLYHGILTGLFFILYAVVRIGVENVRVPDAAPILGITRGQFYSAFMILIGYTFIVWALKTKRRNQPPKATAKAAG